MACGVEPFTLKEGVPPDCPARAIRTTSHGVLQVTVSVCEAVPSAVNLRALPPLNNVSFTTVVSVGLVAKFSPYTATSAA